MIPLYDVSIQNNMAGIRQQASRLTETALQAVIFDYVSTMLPAISEIAQGGYPVYGGQPLIIEIRCNGSVKG